jgi:hypothetical protein
VIPVRLGWHAASNRLLDGVNIGALSTLCCALDCEMSGRLSGTETRLS